MEKTALQSVSAELRELLARRARTGVRWAYPAEFRAESLTNSSMRQELQGSQNVEAERPVERARETLQQIREDLGECTRCKLHGGRTQIVFGVGNPSARLMFVGEGPGRDEDEQGEPFVGAAGQLLTKIIEAIGLSREDVYIANVVRCRPPNNRNPEPDEIAACLPFLERTIASVNPHVLVGLGNVAVKALLGVDTGIMKMRGQWREYCGIPFMPTLHPAYVLRNEAEGRRMIWDDIRKVAERYNENLPEGVKPATIRSKR